MGKKYLRIIIIGFLVSWLYQHIALAQSAKKALDTNNWYVPFYSNGTLFSTAVPLSDYPQIPKGDGISTLFSGGLWLAAKENNQLYVAGQLYDQNKMDFYNGPVANNYTSTNYTSRYNNVWKLNKFEIDNHKQNYSQQNYVVPASIASWPGNGDISNGESLQLAPYMDVNNNKLYDPQNGDYPIIRGDQAVYFIFNDDSLHLASGGKRLKTEVHGMAYAYNNAQDTIMQNVCFLTYTIINRSAINYDSLFIGSFIDTDIGTYSDDFIGCDSAMNVFAGYNANNTDTQYGADPPAQGIMFLNHAMSSFINLNPDGGVQGTPSLDIDYYNFLQAKTKDGKSIKNPYTRAFTKYEYNGIFNGGWTQDSLGGTPADRRGVGTTGPYKFNVGEAICIDLAFVYSKANAGGASASVTKLANSLPHVKQFYNAQNFNCIYTGLSIKDGSEAESLLSVYPNPAINRLSIQNPFNKLTEIVLYNTTGKRVYTATIASLGNVTIDVSAFQQGVYVLHSTITGKTVQQKVVITR